MKVAKKCHCGCEDNAHFKDHVGYGVCLVMRCDCPMFRDADKPNPIRPKRPDHTALCRCFRCREALGLP